MMTTERFDLAIDRVGQGHTISQIIKELYVNWRNYAAQNPPEQRARLSTLRQQYKACHPLKVVKVIPARVILNTTPERHQALHHYCKQQGISVTRFCNKAIAEALQVAREQVSA